MTTFTRYTMRTVNIEALKWDGRNIDQTLETIRTLVDGVEAECQCRSRTSTHPIYDPIAINDGGIRTVLYPGHYLCTSTENGETDVWAMTPDVFHDTYQPNNTAEDIRNGRLG